MLSPSEYFPEWWRLPFFSFFVKGEGLIKEEEEKEEGGEKLFAQEVDYEYFPRNAKDFWFCLWKKQKTNPNHHLPPISILSTITFTFTSTTTHKESPIVIISPSK